MEDGVERGCSLQVAEGPEGRGRNLGHIGSGVIGLANWLDVRAELKT